VCVCVCVCVCEGGDMSNQQIAQQYVFYVQGKYG